jgi:hypothetical protein
MPAMIKEFQKTHYVMLMVFAFGLRASFSAGAWEWIRKNVAILQEVSYDGDYRMFKLQKNEAFQEQYFCETNMNVDLDFMGIKERFYWMFRSELRGGCGNSPSGMVLHPYEVSFGLIPTFEYRFPRFHVFSGLDHRCFHYIDQRPPEPIVYWNKFLMGVNSANRRVHPWFVHYLRDEKWDGLDRFMWSFTWGYYISEFFGLVESRKLMSVDRPHYLHDFNLSARYGVYRWKWGAAVLTGASLLGFKTTGSIYWAQETGAELCITMPLFDTELFVNYIIDDGRFNSKDRLLEYGIRVTK